MQHTNRESWLLASLPRLRAMLEKAKAPAFPEPLISVGLPSKGGLASVRRRIGECWTEKSVRGGGRCTIFISPLLGNPVEVLEVLLHELVHAAVGVKAGHGAPFKAVARGVGLDGPLRATHAGPTLRAELAQLAEELGTYPHDALTHFKPSGKPQVCRQRLYVCDSCGQKIRAATDGLKATHECGGTFILVPPRNDP